MSPRHRLRAERDFARVRAVGKTQRGPLLSVTVAARDAGEPSRFGFVAAKRVGGAVTRNLVKRRLRAIVAARLAHLLDGRDVILSAQPAAAAASFAALEQATEHTLRRARLWRAPDIGVAPPTSPTES